MPDKGPPRVPDEGPPPPRDVVLRALARGMRGGLAEPGSIELTPLSGGSARRSHLAVADRGAWVVRTPADGSSGALGIADECAVTRAAGEHGVTPEVIACDDEAGLLITEYRADATPLTSDLVGRSGNICRIAQLLKHLHGLRMPLRGFDPRSFAARYVGVLGGHETLAPGDRRLAEALTTLADDYCTRYAQRTICHNDLVASNILDDGRRLWLIDFEYAAAAAPILDLANLAAMNDYGGDQRRELTEAYYGESPAPFSQTDLDGVVRMVRLLGYFWATARAREVEDPQPYARFAERLAAALR